MTSMMLIKFFGIYFSVLGFSFFLHHDRMMDVVEEIIGSKVWTFFAGFIPLVMGAFLVVVHPMAMSGIPLFVSILSYLILFVGIFRLVCPNHWCKMVKRMKTLIPCKMMAIFTILIGLWLLSVGYMT